ncbi:MAG: type II secretion system F family protein [Parvibaculum sp.]|uniref:type II secretion system F family protein n=1 Tax=Parvibaculum sp. TaxID=2024848 RepID=UPI002841E967|nr:type II secretion system F family protein [Parvibaculum sp.]MDR3500042.1 type II secretion system F family protein [Parvibaculum sp.]
MSPTLVIFGIAALAALCIAGLGFAFVGKDDKASKRVASVAGPSRKRGSGLENVEAEATDKRRKQVQETLKTLEQKQKAQQKITLRTRIERAGLQMTARNFYMLSATAGLSLLAILSLSGFSAITAILAGFVGALGLPRWILNFLIKRRQNAFLEEFANAIDVIVRGVKSGLPINDCMRIISNEAAEPVRTEFRDLVEGQKLGVSLDQGLLKVYERMPLAEVNFFQIVLAIQQKSGGNLAEALGNLSKVLRDRKKMRAKIQAVSQEAKSSAAIIGALPPGVMGVLYLTAPDYLMPLLTTRPGNMIIVGGLIWMSIGILVMRKMINFNF